MLLFWPKRKPSGFGEIDWSKLSKLTFEPPDYEKFPALKIAFEAAKTGGTAPAVFNAANEVAVDAFLNEQIKYVQIPELIDYALQNLNIVNSPELIHILNTDKETREIVKLRIKELECF